MQSRRPSTVVVVMRSSTLRLGEMRGLTRNLSLRLVVIAAPHLDVSDYEDFGAEVHRAGRLPRVHRVLKSVGPAHVLIVGAGARDAPAVKWWRQLFFHVQDLGIYVAVSRVHAADAPRTDTLFEHLSQVAGTPAKGAESLRGPRRSVAFIERIPGGIMVGKRGQHLLKLRDHEAVALLHTRSTSTKAELIAELPGGEWPPPTQTNALQENTRSFDVANTYPPMLLRRYTGHINLLGGGLAVADGCVLPDSFRWPLQQNPVNRDLINVNDSFARLKHPGQLPERHLEGSYYFFDYRNAGHYGHFMTEALAKLWGWRPAKEQDPDLRILCRTRKRYSGQRIESRILQAYGIDPEDIIWFEEPVWVDSLIGATPMWHNQKPAYVHAGIRQVWTDLRTAVADQHLATAERIFVTRREGNRRCRNVAEVEQLFASHGYRIVKPASMNVSEQATTFASARVVAGFGGTGMFNLLFGMDVRTLIVLNQDAYDSQNEHLFATAFGADAYYFWSAADIAHPANGWSYKAFQSDWEFDFRTNGPSIQSLLRQLE